jgi:ribonuclease-3
LFQRFGKLDEGDLSRVRANLVKQQSLYEIAQALNISDGLRLGEGELRSGGFRRPSILADAFEAIIGAVFLDGGFEAAQGVIKRLYVPILDHIDPRTLGKDAKTLLQEYLQGHKIALPTYTVVATHGAAHNQQFEVECTVPKLDVKVSGSGASRRAAEQAAAKKALDEVLAAAPMLASKPKRSKNARGSKHAARNRAGREGRSGSAGPALAGTEGTCGGTRREGVRRRFRAGRAAGSGADGGDPCRACRNRGGQDRRAAKPSGDKPAEKSPERGEAACMRPTSPRKAHRAPLTSADRQAAGQAAVQPADPASASADKSAAASDPASRTTPRPRDGAAPDTETPPGGAGLAAAQARAADAGH